MEETSPYEDTIEQIYDPATLDNIRRILQIQVEAGKPQSFEIYVDGLRVIPRTTLINVFDNYKTFVHANSRRIKVIIYRGTKTPNCTSHVFIILPKEKPATPQTPVQAQPQPLHGFDFESRLQELMEKERLINKVASLEEKLQERDRKLADAEEYMGKMQSGVEKVKMELESSKSVWGERLLELAKNPPQWVQMMIASKGNFPAINGPESPQGEASFSPKKSPTLTESQQRHLEVLNQMEELLEEEELELIMHINDKLIQEQQLIKAVADLVGISQA